MSSSPILNQGKHPECAGFSILGALLCMNPTIDYQKIAKEIIDEDGNALTLQRASNWFIKKGYIRGIRPVKYSPFLLKKQPLLT